MKKSTVAAGCIAGVVAACGGGSFEPEWTPASQVADYNPAGTGGRAIVSAGLGGAAVASAGHGGKGGAAVSGQSSSAGIGGTGGFGGTVEDTDAGTDSANEAGGSGGVAGTSNAGSGGTTNPATHWECVLSQGYLAAHHIDCDNVHYYNALLNTIDGNTYRYCPSAAESPCPDGMACEVSQPGTGAVSTGTCHNIPNE